MSNIFILDQIGKHFYSNHLHLKHRVLLRSSKVTQFKKIICWLEQDGLSQKVTGLNPSAEIFHEISLKLFIHHFAEKSNYFNAKEMLMC